MFRSLPPFLSCSALFLLFCHAPLSLSYSALLIQVALVAADFFRDHYLPGLRSTLAAAGDEARPAILDQHSELLQPLIEALVLRTQLSPQVGNSHHMRRALYALRSACCAGGASLPCVRGPLIRKADSHAQDYSLTYACRSPIPLPRMRVTFLRTPGRWVVCRLCGRPFVGCMVGYLSVVFEGSSQC